MNTNTDPFVSGQAFICRAIFDLDGNQTHDLHIFTDAKREVFYEELWSVRPKVIPMSKPAVSYQVHVSNERKTGEV